MADQNIKVNINLDITEFNKNAKAMSEALSKVLGKDVKIFADDMQKAEKAINGAEKAMGNAGKTARTVGNSVKQSNMQWTNLALVIQDLPFGFRGIQNNLPALMGSVASVAGPAYLAFSTLIAAVTAYDLGLFGATTKTNNFAKSLAEVNQEIKNTINYTNSEVSSLQGLVDVMLDVNITESVRNKALKEAKEAITAVDEAQGEKIKTVGDAIVAINLYTEAIQQQQMQEVIGKRIAEITLGQIEKRNKLDIERNKAARGFHPIDLFMGNTELQGLESEIIANETLLRQLEDYRKTNTKALLLNPFSNYNKKGPKKGKAKNPALEAQIQEGKDIMLIAERNTKEFEALEKAQAEGARRAAMGGGNVEYIKEPELDPKARAKAFDDKMAFDKKMSKERVDQLKQQYQLEVSEAQGSFQQIKIAEENMRNALNKGFMDGTIKLSEYLVAINDLRKKSNKTVADEAKAAMEETLKIGIGIMNALGPALDMLLEKGGNIGEVSSRAFSDVIKKLVKVAIAAAVAVAIMSMIPGLIQPGKGFATFGNLISQGMGLPTLFANGGIVSGPTLGLMGEYPGASSNPEVVAPLDKLKDMMGNSGGTLETRISGNDLLILVNKANRNNSNTF
jgi:hypothetical protein